VEIWNVVDDLSNPDPESGDPYPCDLYPYDLDPCGCDPDSYPFGTHVVYGQT